MPKNSSRGKESGGAGRRLTQKAIAQALGVSPSVVSLVMRDPGTRRASEATKQRIAALLRRNPGSGRHGRVGDTLLVINRPERDVYYYQSAMLFGIQSRAGEVGLKLQSASPDQDLRVYLFGVPLRGLLLTAPDAATEQVRGLAKTTSVLTLNPQEHGTFLGDAVFPDYYAGMSASVAHLLENGHRRIGYIGELPQAADSRARERLRDFREACDAHRVALDEADIHLYAHDAGDAGDRAAVEAVLSAWRMKKRRPTAFVVYNDNLAVKFYQGARALGIKVPEEVSLVGFDNEPLCEHLQPKLTSVSPEFFELGRMAVDLLVAKEGPRRESPGRKMICPVRLVVRGSVARLNA
jgi:LacI family transcriptional regulator